MTLSRRTLLASGLAASLPLPLSAETNRAEDRAQSLDQLHSLLVLQNGTPLIERRFRGSALDRPASIKSVSKTLVATLLGIAIDKGCLLYTSDAADEVSPV